MSQLKSYHFDVGDSSDGPIGYCARVLARDQRQAVRILNENLPNQYNIITEYPEKPGMEYLTVYFGKTPSAKDIDKVTRTNLNV